MTSMAGIRWEDDNDLLALLEEALDAEGDVPPDFIAAGAMMTCLPGWRNCSMFLSTTPRNCACTTRGFAHSPSGP